MKRLGIFATPLSANEHTGERQKPTMARSFSRPVACKKRGRCHLAHCRYKHVRINVGRGAIEARFEAYWFPTFVSAWWNDSLKTD
jgi:hypothetical protein